MASVIVVCEGESEEDFVATLLRPHLGASDRLEARRTKSIKEGLVGFCRRVLMEREGTHCTTFFDYYEAGDTLTMDCGRKRSPDEMERHLLASTDAVLRERFFPYVQMHELEGLYFSDPMIIREVLQPIAPEGVDVGAEAVLALSQVGGQPEQINDTPEEHPSRRIQRWDQRSSHRAWVQALAVPVGIPKMLAACPRFRAWVAEIQRRLSLP